MAPSSLPTPLASPSSPSALQSRLARVLRTPTNHVLQATTENDDRDRVLLDQMEECPTYSLKNFGNPRTASHAHPPPTPQSHGVSSIRVCLCFFSVSSRNRRSWSCLQSPPIRNSSSSHRIQRNGAELMCKIMNDFFSILLQIVKKYGGDIIKVRPRTTASLLCSCHFISSACSFRVL